MKAHKLPGARIRRQCSGFRWMVLIGNELKEAFVCGPVPPDEETVRREFNLAADTPVLVGMP